MTLSSAGFVGEVTDVEFAILQGLRYGDVIGGNVSAASGDRTVSVGSFFTSCGGVLVTSDATETVQVPTNPSSFSRIDRIIVRARWSDSFIQLTYRAGTPSSNPQPPALTQEPGVQYEVDLADVRVGPGQGSLSQSDITRTNTPPSPGFYWVSSIGQAPYPEQHPLVYHSPTGRLMVGTDSGMVVLAGGATSESALPSPGGSGWNHSSTYQSRAGHVSVNIDIYRSGGNTSENNVRLGILPAGSRPPNQIYRTIMNQHSGESFLVEIRTSGLVSCIAMQADNGERIRGGFSFLAGG